MKYLWSVIFFYTLKALSFFDATSPHYPGFHRMNEPSPKGFVDKTLNYTRPEYYEKIKRPISIINSHIVMLLTIMSLMLIMKLIFELFTEYRPEFRFVFSIVLIFLAVILHFLLLKDKTKQMARIANLSKKKKRLQAISVLLFYVISWIFVIKIFFIHHNTFH